MNKVFIVEGMTCASCSAAVERVLNRRDAVQSASVNLTTKKLVLDYDASALTVDEIQGLIEKAGYEATEYIESKQIVMPIDGMT